MKTKALQLFNKGIEPKAEADKRSNSRTRSILSRGHNEYNKIFDKKNS